jgi:hypothetical protein
MVELRTLQEWSSILGITILDPDGFDRTDPMLMERKFTLSEFNQGIVSCTCSWERDSWKRLDVLVKEVYGDVPESTSQSKEETGYSS